jgi:hypothetical protein
MYFVKKKSPVTMTRILIALFAFLQISFTQAQSFSIAPNPAYASADLDVNPFIFEFIAETDIVNNTSEVLYLKWERILNEKPECWLTSISDVNMSHFPMVSTGEFQIQPKSQNNYFNVHAFPMAFSGTSAASGEAHVILRVTNLDIPSDTLLVDYYLTAIGDISCSVTGISQKEKNALNIYPNPASDFIQLTENSLVRRLVVYNVLGSPVVTFNALANQKFDISGLPKGVYMVELVGQNGETTKTVKLLKD